MGSTNNKDLFINLTNKLKIMSEQPKGIETPLSNIKQKLLKDFELQLSQMSKEDRTEEGIETLETKKFPIEIGRLQITDMTNLLSSTSWEHNLDDEKKYEAEGNKGYEKIKIVTSEGTFNLPMWEENCKIRLIDYVDLLEEKGIEIYGFEVDSLDDVENVEIEKVKFFVEYKK